MRGVSFKKSWCDGKSTGGDVSETTSSATPRQRLDVSTWTFNPVDTVSLEVVLAEMGRFKATQRSLSPFKWSLIARVMTGRTPTSRATNRRVWMSPGASAGRAGQVAESSTLWREDVFSSALQLGQHLLELLHRDTLLAVFQPIVSHPKIGLVSEVVPHRTGSRPATARGGS